VLVGFIAGLVAGLAIAVAVALYLTNSPVPFVNKVQRPTENVNPAAGGQLPDPNKPLYSNQSPPALPAQPGAPEAAPESAPAAANAPAGAPPAAKPQAPSAAAAPSAGAATAAAAAPDAGGRLLLQTGAFKTIEDADTMRARLALLGLDAKVSPTQQEGGATLYRVRLGPYGQLDDLNGIRRTLAENGIEAQVVHSR
jgi:cell division protein FtsN